MFEKKPLEISIFNTEGLTSMQQVLETTASETFTFTDSTSTIMLIPTFFPFVEIIKKEEDKAVIFKKKKHILDKEISGWLKVAEKSFEFWDNEIDDLWNDV